MDALQYHCCYHYLHCCCYDFLIFFCDIDLPLVYLSLLRSNPDVLSLMLRYYKVSYKAHQKGYSLLGLSGYYWSRYIIQFFTYLRSIVFPSLSL